MKNNSDKRWLIAGIFLFMFMIFGISLAYSDSTYGKTDGQIKMQNDVIDWVGAYTSDATFSLNSEKITVDTLVVDSVFTFSGAISVGAITGSSTATISGITTTAGITITDTTKSQILMKNGTDVVGAMFGYQDVSGYSGMEISNVYYDGSNWKNDYTKDVPVCFFINTDAGKLEWYVSDSGSATVGSWSVMASIDSLGNMILADSLYVGGNLGVVGTIDGATVNTGQGNYELYAMNQDVESTDSVTFDDISITDSLFVGDDAEITDDLSVSGETTLSGGVTYNYTAVEDTVYTVLISDYIIDISHTDTADTVHVTIPTALISAGKMFQIWDTEFNAGTNNIIISTEGAEVINEAAADTISTDGGKRIIWSDGTNWFSRE